MNGCTPALFNRVDILAFLLFVTVDNSARGATSPSSPHTDVLQIIHGNHRIIFRAGSEISSAERYCRTLPAHGRFSSESSPEICGDNDHSYVAALLSSQTLKRLTSVSTGRCFILLRNQRNGPCLSGPQSRDRHENASRPNLPYSVSCRFISARHVQ